MRTRNLLLPALLILTVFCSAGKTLAQKTENWETLIVKEGVSMYYELGNCLKRDVIFLKIENTGENDINLIWSLWEGQDKKSVRINAGQTITGACVNRLPEHSLIEFIPDGKSAEDIHPVIEIIVL